MKEFDKCNKFYSVNPLYWIINHKNGFIEEKHGSKYLIIYFSDDEMFSKSKNFGTKFLIQKVNNDDFIEYGKDYMRIKSGTDDSLPLNKSLNFLAMTIIIRLVFKEDGKLYPQINLNECLYEL